MTRHRVTRRRRNPESASDAENCPRLRGPGLSGEQSFPMIAYEVRFPARERRCRKSRSSVMVYSLKGYLLTRVLIPDSTARETRGDDGGRVGRSNLEPETGHLARHEATRHFENSADFRNGHQGNRRKGCVGAIHVKDPGIGELPLQR